MVKHRNLNSYKRTEEKGKFDFLLFSIVLMLSVFGILMVFDASTALLSSKYHFVILQSIWVLIGFVLMIFVSFYDYRKLTKLALPLMIISIIFLIVVLGIGQRINGAIRWINIGPFQFQPSEIVKPVLIIYLSAWFAKEKPILNSFFEKLKFSFFNEFIPLISLSMLIIILILIGKDLGTAIIIGIIALGMYFIQGTDFFSILNLIASLFIVIITGVIAIFIEPYRFQRLLNFTTGYTKDPLSGGYQISQILIAIGSGGLFGKGFTQSIQKQRYLVETTAATDSIFAVIAEEFGFIGSLILFLGYLFFFYKCLRIAIASKDSFAKFLTMGIVIWIIFQALLNISVNIGLVPLTGIPLPFISYGGSSTIIMLSSIGIILNISKQIKRDEE